MKRHLLPILMVLAAGVLIQGCFAIDNGWCGSQKIRGSGDLVQEERPVGEITSVELATIGLLNIELGDTEKLIIEAEDNLLEYLETDVHRGHLVIDNRNNYNLQPRKRIRYLLTVRSLEAIEISSSGDIEAPDLKADRFKININSSGNLDMGDLECKSLDIDISSSGNVDLGMLTTEFINVDISSSGDIVIEGGTANEQEINISSSGDYSARRLESNEAVVHINSSGNAIINVRDRLRASTNSSGDIRYYGNPRVSKSQNSSGRVRQAGGGSRRSST